MNQPFHSVHFYFPRKALIAIADNAEAQPIGDLRYSPGVGMEDPVIRSLATALLPAFKAPEQASSLFLEHVMMAAGAHVVRTYGGLEIVRRALQGGLAPWQEHRVRDILMANLDGDVRLEDLAREVGLSVSHFARSFRQTLGMAPHQWLVKRRVEAAIEMMRDPRNTLPEIALACGFADQSHLTRVFSKHVGMSPGAWRRMLH